MRASNALGVSRCVRLTHPKLPKLPSATNIALEILRCVLMQHLVFACARLVHLEFASAPDLYLGFPDMLRDALGFARSAL